MSAISDFLSKTGASKDRTRPVRRIPDFRSPTAGEPQQGTVPIDDPIKWYYGYSDSWKLRRANEQAKTIDPQRAKRVLNMQLVTGLPTDLIDANLDAIELEHQKDAFDTVKFREESPIVARWYAENPHRMAIMREDFDKMGAFERNMRALSLGYRHGKETNELGRAARDLGFGNRSKELRDKIDTLDRDLKATPSGESFAARWLYEGAKIVGQVVDSIWEAKERVFQGAVTGASYAVAAGQLGPQALSPEEVITVPAGALAGAGYGLLFGFAEEAFLIESGHAYLEMDRIRGIEGEVIDEDAKRNAANFVGVVNAALEVVGFKIASMPFKKLARKLTADPVKNALTSATFRRALTEFGKNWGMAIFGEVSTEIAQEGMNILGEQAAEMFSEGRFEDVDDMTRLANIASQTFRGMTIAGLPGATANFVVDAHRALNREQMFLEIADVVNTVIKENGMPETEVASLVNEISKESNTHVRIPVEKLVELWRKRRDGAGNRIDLMTTAQELLGDTTAFETALKSGGDVLIPMSVFTTKMLTSEDSAFYAQEQKIDPDDRSPREMRERIEEIKKGLFETPAQIEAARTEKAGEREAARTPEVRPTPEQPLEGAIIHESAQGYRDLLTPQKPQSPQETKEIVDKIAKQPPATPEELAAQEVERRVQEALERVGLDPVLLEPYLRAISQRAITRARRRGLGEDPLELFERTGLEFVLEELEGLRRRRALQEQEEVPLTPVAQKAFDEAEGDINKAIRRLESRVKEVTSALEKVDPKDAAARKELTQQRTDARSATRELRRLKRAGQRRVRGGIDLTNRSNVVVAFTKHKDLSTFLHEVLGHLALEELVTDAFAEGTPQQLRTDLDVLLGWWGIKVRTVDGEKAVRAAITHDHHEQFARGFEVFAREGKAPSKELRDVFNRFKVWLLEIYKDVRQLKVTLTSEVRGVMDRLLAADEAIEETLTEQYDFNIVPELKNIGMTDKQAASVQRGVTDSVDSYITDLRIKLIAQEERKQTKEWKKQEQQVADQETRAAHEDPAIVALIALSDGTNPDGTPFVPATGRKPDKLSRDAVAAEYSEGRLDGLPKSIFHKDPSEGLAADLAAEDFVQEGRRMFADGDAMLHAIEEAFQEEVQSSPLFAQLTDLRKQINALEQQQDALEVEALRRKKELRKGAAGLAKPLASAQQVKEKAEVAELKTLHKEIKQRGKIQPSEPTEDLIKEFQAKEGEGVQSDRLADELYDRGILDEPSSFELYRWVRDGLARIKGLPKTLKGIETRARQVAGRMVTKSAEALIANVRQQDALTVELKQAKKEMRKVQRGISAKARVKNIIGRRVEERMIQLNPTMEISGEILNDAIEATFNDNRARVLREIGEFFVSEHFAKFHTLNERLNRGRIISDRQIKAEARAIIMGAASMREVNPNDHKANMAKQKKEMLRAIGRKDWRAAILALERQRLTHELYREAVQVRKEFNADVKLLKKINTKATQEMLGKAKHNYREQVNGRLEAIELRYISPEVRGKREAFRDWYEREAEDDAGLAANMDERLLDEMYSKNVNDMNPQEFFDISNAIKSLLHQASFKNKLLRRAKERALDQLAEDGERAIIEGGGLPPIPKPVRVEHGNRRRGGIIGKITTPFLYLSKWLMSFLSMQRKTASLTYEMDGFKVGGFMFENYTNPKNKAGEAETTRIRQENPNIEKLWKLLDKSGDIFLARIVPELGIELSKKDEIAIALNWGNVEGRQRVRTTMEILLQRKLTEAEAGVVVQTILSRITTRDEWNFIRGAWKYLNTFWPESKELSERVKGIAPEKVELLDVQTPFGVIEGGWYPLRYDLSMLESEKKGAKQKQQDEVEELVSRAMGGESFQSMTRHRHRKNRRKHVEQPLLLSLDVIPRAVYEIIHDLTHFEFLVDAWRFIRHPKMANAIKRHYGEAAYKEFLYQIRLMAAGGMPARNAFERALGYIRRGSSTAILALRTSVAMIQPMGLTQVRARIPLKHMNQAMMGFLGHPEKMVETLKEIWANSQMMRNRGTTMLREINEVQNVISPTGKLKRAMQAWGAYATMRTQQFVDLWIWQAAHLMHMEQVQPELAPNDEARKEAYQKVYDLNDQIVIDTQGSGQLKDLSRFQADSELTKQFSLFTTFFNARWNLSVESLRRAGREGHTFKSMHRLAVDYMFYFMFPAVGAFMLHEAVRGRGEDDTDTDFNLRLLQAILTEPLGDIIFVREFTGSLGYKYEGPAGLKLIGELSELSVQAAQLEFDAGLWRELNDVAGVLFHYPSEQIEASFRGFAAWEEGKAGMGAILLGPPRQSSALIRTLKSATD